MRTLKDAEYDAPPPFLQILKEIIRSSWALLQSLPTLNDLKAEIHRPRRGIDDVAGLRSLSWRAFLVFKNLRLTQWSSECQKSRTEYSSTRHRLLLRIEHPDEEDSSTHPLSQETDSPWNTLRHDELLRQEILLDVERCMSENLYFRQPSTQNSLLDMLFIWSKSNPEIGYRQGMHEILAPILWAVERDAIDPRSINNDSDNLQIIKDVCNAHYMIHDTYAIFAALMENLKSSYAPPLASQGSPGASFGNNDTSLFKEPPIVQRSRRIADQDLARTDIELSDYLQHLDIAPQLFLMRWIRMIFGREFSFNAMIDMWDCLFSADPSLKLMDNICIIMLLRIRWQIVTSDYNGVLSLLLRYPEPQDTHGPRNFVLDAIYLRDHFNFDGASQIVFKYSQKPLPLINRPSTPQQSMDEKHSSRSSKPGYPVHREASRPPRNLEDVLHDTARGVYIQGESVGLNRAFRNAATEIRKGVRHIPSRRNSRRRPSPSVDKNEHSAVARLENLEARNKSLAKMLGDATGELWQQQNALSTVLPTEKLKALTMAIAKVQLAQVYLDDSTLSLPVEGTDSGEESQYAEDRPQQEAHPSSHEESENSKVEQTNTEQANRRKTNPAGSDRAQGEDEASHPLPPSTKSSVPTSSSPHKARPSLDQSSFSFMLGQGEPSQSSRAAPRKAPMRARASYNHRQNVGYLFGDTEDDEAPSKGVRDADHERDDETAFQMGTLKGRKKG